MDAVLSTSAGILHTLTEGPRYGRDLIRLLDTRAQGALNPRPGTVYRAFGSLVRKGYVRKRIVVPGGRRGARSRTYYELTPRGIAAAERQRKAIAHLLGFPARLHSTAEAHLMEARLRRVAEVSAFTLALQKAVRQAARRRS
jgi:DNA-binding PadR family transcriptional regulator